jgi:hypothetical protein
MEKVKYCECEHCGRMVIYTEHNGEMLCDRCLQEARSKDCDEK